MYFSKSLLPVTAILTAQYPQMKDFADCPRTLASNVEGFRLDAILVCASRSFLSFTVTLTPQISQKRNKQIQAKDLWARLPPDYTVEKVDGSKKTVKLKSPAGLTNHSYRFRHRACILSWSKREGAQETRDFLW